MVKNKGRPETEGRSGAGDPSFFNESYFGIGEGKKTSNYGPGGYREYRRIGFWRHTIDAIRRHVENPEDKRFLDVGCAFGYLIGYMSDFGEVCGADISMPALSEAKKVVQQESAGFVRVNLDNADLPFEENSFDCITALDVCEHTHDFGRSVQKIAKVAKPGGIIIVGTPITDTLEGKIWSRFLDRDASHVSVPSTRQLKEDHVQSAGLEILESRYYWPLPWFAIPFPRTNMKIVARKLPPVPKSVLL
jgi:SAM-dependent methyltransferase